MVKHILARRIRERVRGEPLGNIGCGAADMRIGSNGVEPYAAAR